MGYRLFFLFGFCLAAAGEPLARKNCIDVPVFGRMERDRIPHAPLASDSEFLRRVYLDLTGRLPDQNVARRFLADKDPAKRDTLIDSLIPPVPTTGFGRRKPRPFLDRWTYFFCDLFRNN